MNAQLQAKKREEKKTQRKLNKEKREKKEAAKREQAPRPEKLFAQEEAERARMRQEKGLHFWILSPP
jgi:hypothetical protein